MDLMVRQPPHALDAEMALLGGLMISPVAYSRIADKVREEDFYRQDHRLIFRAIASLSAQGFPCDAVTLGDYFEAQRISERVGGTRYVIELANGTPSAANVTAYAEIVREKAILRGLIDAGTELLEAAYRSDGRKAQDVADGAIRALMAMTRANTRHEFTLKQSLKMVHEELADAAANGPKIGIPTGVQALDRAIGGFHNGEFAIFGARPKMGKTAALLTSIDAALAAGHPVGIISAEESAVQGARRMIAGRSGVSAGAIRVGKVADEQWPRLTDAIVSLAEAKAWVFDEPAPSVERVAQVARRWKQEHGIKALYVDYVQRLTIERASKNAQRFEKVGEIARALSTLARDLDIPVISAAQVKRDVETRADKRPNMGDLSDSAELEKEAACIVMLYRDEVYNPDTEHKGIAEMLVEANRWGPPCFVRAAWHGERMRFGDLVYGGSIESGKGQEHWSAAG